MNQIEKRTQLPLAQPWDRIFPLVTRLMVWGLLFGIIYILRTFFLLVFLTFVFAYIQTSGMQHLKQHINNRIIRVIIVGTLFLSILIAVGIFLVPKVKRQAEVFVNQFAVYINRADMELIKLSKKYPLLTEIIPELKELKTDDSGEAEKKFLRTSPTASLIQQFIGLGEETTGLKNVNQILDTLGSIGGKLASIVSAFLLSLLFSFLIVLDLPKLSASVAKLEHTRLRFIYIEVAENIREFSHVLGKALEAQFIIAVANSMLTALGIYFLGMGKSVAFLSVIVFFCSFIPVVGVFISSVPICLISLQTSGLQIMILAILLIFIIHMIEGYILNPRIYGSYMRINPVIVLIILTIGGKLFHVWGLILGVPICTYVFGHAIRYSGWNNK